MADNLVDARTDALGKAFIVQAGRNGIIVPAILHANIIYLLRCHARPDSRSDGIETACIYLTCDADAFNLFWGLYKIARRHFPTLVFPIHHLLVKLCNGNARQAMPPFLLKFHTSSTFKLGCKNTIYN